MEITRKVQKWGNSAGVRFPQQVLEQVNLSINQPVKFTIQGNSIVLTPIKMPVVTPGKVSDFNGLDEISDKLTSLIKPGTVPLTDVDAYYQANRDR